MNLTSVSAIFEPADFFISYTGVDEKCAEWIASCLEDANYRVIFQKWDFRPGHNFVLLMHAALSVARQVIAVLSPAYEEALFTKPEWAASFVIDPIGKHRKLIPVRIVEFDPVGILAPIIYVDLVKYLEKKDEAGARQTLLQGVSDGRAKPVSDPPFPPYGNSH